MSAARAHRPARRRLGLDRFEAATLLALATLSVVVLASLLARVWVRGGLVSGADGYVVVDQMQYVAWLRQAADHVGAGNLFDLMPGSRSLVHPGVVISGLVHRLGVDEVVAYQLWKPVAVALLFAGALLYSRRFLPGLADRRLALVLALFATSPVAAAIAWAGLAGAKAKTQVDFLTGELWTGTYLWGYPFTAIAVGAMPLGLLAYERGRAQGSRAMLAWAAAAGLLVSWLQPWQGATYALVLIGAEALIVARRGRPARAAAIDLLGPLAATALPLGYYYVLGRSDPSWELAQQANDLARWPLWVIVVGLAPLAIPAALAYRGAGLDFGGLALRLWPIVGVVVFYLPLGTFPFHAFQGLTLPLVVLGVIALRRGLGSRPLPLALAGALVLVLVVPGTAYRGEQIRGAIVKALQPFYLETGERDALRHLERLPERGGVLAPYYSGQLLPAYTGRETWVGAVSWTPAFKRRTFEAEALFSGRADRRSAEALVRRSGARFLLSDCQARSDISALVERVAGPPRRFGCAAVYRVAPE